MEALGLIERIPSDKDQRKVIVSLNEKGKMMREDAANIPYNLIKKLGIETENVDVNEMNEMKSKLYNLIQLLKNL